MEEDLSHASEPLGGFLCEGGGEAAQWPFDDGALQRCRLTEEQVAAFERDGFVAGVPVLNDVQVERLRKDLAEIMDPGHPKHRLWHEFNENEAPEHSGTVLFHSLGAWRISPAFHDLVFSPHVAVPCAQLLETDRVRLWHDQVFAKPAGHGAVVAWHQDYSYWTRTSPMRHLTVHIALDDQEEENGGLLYVPGSHRWPLLPVTSRHFGDMDSVRSVLDEAQQRQLDGAVCPRLRKGQAAIHHALTLHGSRGNSSPGPRRAAVVNVVADGVAATEDGVLLDGLPPQRAGEPLCGRFFPLLLRA